jgi:NADPH:quinone reductase-like Zn-dependent oxidoreductase
LGIISYGEATVTLGIEFSGTIGRIGSLVENLSIGDRVFGMSSGGVCASLARVEHSLVRKMPQEMSFEDAATIPCCFATVIQSIVEVGRMEKGQVAGNFFG